MKLHEKRIEQSLNRKSDLIDRADRLQTTIDGIPLPSWIEISPIDVCNRKCIFCPKSNEAIAPDNINTTTPTHCYELLFNELENLGFTGTVMFAGYGEPLLAKNILEVLPLVKSRFRTEVTTNGDVLKPKRIEALFNAGLDYMVVSLYDGPEQVEKFQKMFQEASIDSSKFMLRERWFTEEDDFGVKLTNRTGTVEVGQQPEVNLDKACYYPHYSCMIDWNGDFFLCTQDWNRRKKWGNVFIQGFASVWFSRELTSARKKLANGVRQGIPCSMCNANGTLHGATHAKAWLEHKS